ncbi:MAG: response regulator [Desulfobacterales bacterium]|nr:response regulator [Desulfobacterales bacterium]
MPKKKIMIVEDDVLISKMLEISLQYMGYEITSIVNSGELAVKKAEDRPDLILMDITLSGEIDGVEAANQIRTKFKTPIIYLTALSDDEIFARARQTQASGYLIKPFQEAELKATIEMAIYKTQIEEELLKAKKFETIATLAGGLAHDFNNLLMIMLGHMEMVQEELDPHSLSDESLKIAIETLFQARDLISKFISLSQGGNPNKKKYSILKVIEQSAVALLDGSNVKYEINKLEEPLIFEFDIRQIRQVFDNLFENSKEAMPKGGKILISIKKINVFTNHQEPIQSIKDGNYIKVIINDHGIGIIESDIPKVFDPYFSTKQRGNKKGMGLGLAVVYSIISKHDGYIHIESKPEEGTTVYLYLPNI